MALAETRPLKNNRGFRELRGFAEELRPWNAQPERFD